MQTQFFKLIKFYLNGKPSPSTDILLLVRLREPVESP